jgi:uncharacterized protein (TIGR02246 family)
LAAATVLAVGVLLGWMMASGRFGTETQAQEKTVEKAAETSPRAADEKAIREASRGIARAFEKGDAKALASFWTEEGEYVDEGEEPVHGRAALEKAYAGFFAKRKEVKVQGKTDKIRFLGTDTAIEEGTFTVHAEGSPPNASRYSALFVRQDGRWLVALMKEWNEDTAKEVKLDDLAWLIGTWKSDAGGPQAHADYEWTENKKFIRCKYTVTHAKNKADSTAGTQIIGIDPAVGAIRSWTFDSAGGIGEASWTFDGQRWVIHSTGTLGDGTETTATNFMQPKGHDAFSWRSVQRTHNNEKQPDIGPVQVNRVAKQEAPRAKRD